MRGLSVLSMMAAQVSIRIYRFKERTVHIGGQGSSVSIETAYGVDDPGIESLCGRDFRTSPDRP